jgi:hypothetical protein
MGEVISGVVEFMFLSIVVNALHKFRNKGLYEVVAVIMWLWLAVSVVASLGAVANVLCDCCLHL